jgi:hypothetical protein
MSKLSDHAGKKYNRLTGIRFVGIHGSCHHSVWEWQCDCGNKKELLVYHVVSGNTKSCGCLRTERAKDSPWRTKHGGRGKRLYKTWSNMKQRCNNPKSHDYKRYGGRGIKICEEWNDYLIFEVWALSNGYADHLTIDRIDNDDNYNPSNCQWITRVENTNKRNGHEI